MRENVGILAILAVAMAALAVLARMGFLLVWP